MLSVLFCVLMTAAVVAGSHTQVKGLYKGMSAPLVGITPIFAVCFWAYDLSKKLMRKMSGMAPTAELSLTQIGIAGALSAVPTTVRRSPSRAV